MCLLARCRRWSTIAMWLALASFQTPAALAATSPHDLAPIANYDIRLDPDAGAIRERFRHQAGIDQPRTDQARTTLARGEAALRTLSRWSATASAWTRRN